MRQCKVCGEIKPLTSFWLCSDKKNRYQTCPQCMYKDRKGKQTPEQKAIQQEARYAWRKSIKTRLVNHFGNRCVVCGNTYPQSVFDFHHKDPTQKEAQVGTMGSYEKCLKEAEKCILVCANCHRMIHNDEI